jgi:hypothetical protein
MHPIGPPDVGSYSYAGMGYANPHAVTSVVGTTYAYDNNGNVTAIGSLDYTWDWRNRLASAERSGGGTTSYGYDHTGQRVFQATGSATTSYPNRYYNVASSSLTATTTKHIFSPDGTLLATVVGSGMSTASTTYLHPDHLGGTNVATDGDGEVVRTLDYYPYVCGVLCFVVAAGFRCRYSGRPISTVSIHAPSLVVGCFSGLEEQLASQPWNSPG